MATMLAEVYDALLEAGASPESSRKAAEAVAAFDGRANRLESDLSERTTGLRGEISKVREDMAAFRGETRERFAKIEGELVMLRWMVGLVVAGVATLIARSFFV
jgi:hypothetical protein